MTKILLLIFGFGLVSIQVRSQELWGMTPSGGANSLGTIFKTDINGTNHSVVYDFQSSSIGVDPYGYMVKVPNGNLYGVTQEGGKYGKGVLFEFNPTSLTYSVKVDFNEYSCTSLTLHPNGKMYGPGSGRFPSVGAIIEFDPTTDELTAKADFEEESTGAIPGELLLASNGKFYGTTHQGGLNNEGVLFEYDPFLNSLMARVHFKDENLRSYSANLIQANNGKIYGFAKDFIKFIFFEFDVASNQFSKRHDLTDCPYGRLINSNDHLYSMAMGRMPGAAMVLEFDIEDATVDVIDFSSYSGIVPHGLSKDLLFYAFTDGHISLFGFDPPSGIVELANLETLNDAPPIGEAIRHTNGKVYGFTNKGVFEFNPQSNSIIHKSDFSYPPDGVEPRGSLTWHPNRNFYGVTQGSGENNLGIVFEFNPRANSYKKIANFIGTLNGAIPYSDLVVAKNGKLYGTTFNGGIYDDGVVFEIDPYSNNLVSKKADLNKTTGGRPSQGLFAHSNGKLYFVTGYGVTGYGAIFEFDPDMGGLIKKADLDITTGGPDSGWGFRSTFTELSNGNLLFVGKGIFEFDPSTGSISKKMGFTANLSVTGNLVPHPSGKFYATSAFGNELYEYDSSNNMIKVVFDFESSLEYGTGLSALTLNPKDNNLYGMALGRGSNNLGTIYKYDPTNNTFTKTFDFDYLNGANPSGDLIFVKGDQTINFDELPNKTYGDPSFILNATSSSGLNVIYASSDPTIAQVNGNSVTVLKPGTVTVSAEQPGNNIYFDAQPVSRDLSVAKAGQTISFGELDPVDLEQGSIELIATSTSLLPVGFLSSDQDIASITGIVLNLHAPGAVTITANQSGTTNFLAADPVSRELIIQKIVGIAEQESTLSLYPNPVLDHLTIVTDEQVIESSIINTCGQLLHRATEKQFDLRALASGVYFVKIQTSFNVSLLKFLKK